MVNEKSRHSEQTNGPSALESALWPAWSLLFLLALWASLWNVHRTAELLPVPSLRFGGQAANTSASPSLLQAGVAGSKILVCCHHVCLHCLRASPYQPIHACLQLLNQLSTHHAWLLGRLAEQYNTSRIEEPAALDTAACLLIHPLHAAECPAGTAARHLPQLTGQTLLDLEGLLQSHSVGSLKRLSGVFSFANIVWVLGAIGIALAFFPAIYPLLAMVAAALGPAVVLLLQILQPWYGLFIYAGCWYIIAFATK